MNDPRPTRAHPLRPIVLLTPAVANVATKFALTGEGYLPIVTSHPDEFRLLPACACADPPFVARLPVVTDSSLDRETMQFLERDEHGELKVTAEIRGLGVAGVELIRRERHRQIEEEGHTAENDDEYTEGELISVASNILAHLDPTLHVDDDDAWGLVKRHERRPDGPRRLLVIAGALIAAELDRQDRERRRKPEEASGGEE